jgi:hypothetical protein
MMEDVKPGAASADALSGKVGGGSAARRMSDGQTGGQPSMGTMAIVIGYKSR